MTRAPKTLGAQLRALRLAARLSQSELSARCGIPKPTLSRYENDHVMPSVTTLRKIATALGVPVTAMLTVADRADDHLTKALERRGIYIKSAADAEHLVDLIADRVDGEQATGLPVSKATRRGAQQDDCLRPTPFLGGNDYARDIRIRTTEPEE